MLFLQFEGDENNFIYRIMKNKIIDMGAGLDDSHGLLWVLLRATIVRLDQL